MTKGMTALHVTVGQSTEKNWLEVSSQILIISQHILYVYSHTLFDQQFVGN